MGEGALERAHDGLSLMLMATHDQEIAGRIFAEARGAADLAFSLSSRLNRDPIETRLDTMLPLQTVVDELAPLADGTDLDGKMLTIAAFCGRARQLFDAAYPGWRS